MIETVWKVGKYEFPCDSAEADFQEKYEKAKEQYQTTLGEINDSQPMAQNTRIYCRATRAFFDELFGSGSSAKIFEGLTDNYKIYSRISNSFAELIRKQNEETTKEFEKYTKYAPKKASHAKK